MTTALRELELVIFNDATRRDASELTEGLREILGAQLVSYLGNVRETRAVRQWAGGTRRPSTETVERLRLAYRVARLIEHREGRAVAQAWFPGRQSPPTERVSRKGNP